MGSPCPRPDRAAPTEGRGGEGARAQLRVSRLEAAGRVGIGGGGPSKFLSVRSREYRLPSGEKVVVLES